MQSCEIQQPVAGRIECVGIAGNVAVGTATPICIFVGHDPDSQAEVYCHH
jgi:hypothetical protein